MFDDEETPRVFGVPPGVDFPAALIAGLRERIDPTDPTAMARVDLIVNTRRMARRLRQIFDAGPAGLLPRIHLVTDLDALATGAVPPPAVPPLRKRLELIQLVAELLEQMPDLGPSGSVYDLADSLATLLDEMQGEDVPLGVVTGLDVTDQSGHWDRAKRFIAIADQYLNLTDGQMDTQGRNLAFVKSLVAQWQAEPPSHPIIVAGSTGSRGAVHQLMRAVARQPNGAVVLPGFDDAMPDDVWTTMTDAMVSEDHPQFRFRKLADALDTHPRDIAPWTSVSAPDPVRDRVVSLALRPAPVTDAWLIEGPEIEGLERALDAVTIVNAETPRAEAVAIAMRLRQAVEAGEKAALITPDRMLGRQVTAALDQWGILPDDSAGVPLQLTPPGRFLRHVAQLFRNRLDAEALLTLLKHPLTHSGHDRNLHQLKTQALELRIREVGMPYPTVQGTVDRALETTKAVDEHPALQAWAEWVGAAMIDKVHDGKRPLADWVKDHRMIAEAIAAGDGASDSGALWEKSAGQEARAVMDALADEAGAGGLMSAVDYDDLFSALLAQGEVRDRDAPFANVMIWGTLEARVQGADLVILGGMNDGIWPQAPAPDPWLNRAMRQAAGLLLPERRIGLSAHDFQQAVGAPEVWITRAIRNDDSETVPSRWVNRLQNLMCGLGEHGGKAAWQNAESRGDTWLRRVAAFERPAPVSPAARPSPRPPVSARPRELFVTEIKKLVRDPYAVYAKHCLKLRPLDPLVPDPDARMRGILVHTILERFVKDTIANPDLLTAQHLGAVAAKVMASDVPWPTVRALWQARMERVADWFVAREAERRETSTPLAMEKKAQGQLKLADIGMTIGCFADRIDLGDDGAAILYDYKTGNPPTKKEQQHFDKQLLIEAAMLEQGAFADAGTHPVGAAIYIGLSAPGKEVAAPLTEEPPAKTLADLRNLLKVYLDPQTGYTARRANQTERFTGDYDQLARYGEWDSGDTPVPEDLE